MIDFISKNIRHWLLHQPVPAFARNFDRMNRLFWKYPVQVSIAPAHGTLVAQDRTMQIHFAHPERVMRYARQGIRPFLERLAAAYMVDAVPLARDDWVIDCGANVGELSMALLGREPGLKVVAVEPEAREADCTDANIYQGQPRTLRKVLWHEETTLRFFSAPATADSSVFEPPVPHVVREVMATTLDALVSSISAPRIRILKLEAEGAEPEILRGAESALAKIDYITADLGPERGMSQEQTATPVINFLLARGFDLVDMKFDRVVCLFKNRQVQQ